MLAVLYSNLSNAYLSQREYTSSRECAEKATQCDPTFVKAWLRYVHASRLDGYPFEAFVALLRHLRPLVREQSSLATGAAATKLLVELEADVDLPLYKALGLSNVLPHIELESFESGMGIIARKPIKPNDVILVEEKFETSFAELDLNVQCDLTTIKIVTHFAKKAFPLQQQRSAEWLRFRKEFKGCWPRCPGDVPAEMHAEVAEKLRPQLPSMSDEDFEELYLFAMMCRYNCFRSGFFRACALANHSCIANAAMKYNPGEKSMTLIAVRHIAAGEFVNVKYLSDAQFLMGVGKRREYLRSWLFWCACSRCCSDSDGTFGDGAPQEQMQCAHCHRFTHLPFSSIREAAMETDPLIPREAPCLHCGATVSWSTESRQLVEQVTDSFKIAATYTRVDEITEWFTRNVAKVHEVHVHPKHWLYRVLLYFFCVPLTSLINEHFVKFRAVGWHGSHVEALLLQFGLRRLYQNPFTDDYRDSDQPAPVNAVHDGGVENADLLQMSAGMECGGDLLYALSILWRLIEPFYPPYEGWALHRAICQLTLFALTNPRESVAMPASEALQILRCHGKFLGSADASLWISAYNQHKPTGKHRGILSNKQIKSALQLS
ncbi:SET domain [Trypanosoma vivax]|nr:SET domain [Trypanosoma vivax]